MTREIHEVDFATLGQLSAGPELSLETAIEARLGEYPSVDTIINHLDKNLPSQHIKSDTLRKNGRLVQDSMEKYLSTRTHLSSGNFKAALNTMMHFQYDRDEAFKKELQKHKDTSHFDLSTFLHECILEPTKFSRVVTEPKASRTSHAGLDELILFWTAQIEKEIDLLEDEAQARVYANLRKDYDEILQPDTKPTSKAKKEYIDCLKGMSAYACIKEEDKIAVDTAFKNYKGYANGILPRIVKHSKREVSMYATDPDTGLDVRIRPDAIQFRENIGLDAIISVKSSRQEKLAAFAKQCAKLNYDLSEGMYQRVATQVTGRPFQTTLMIIVQTVAPFAVALVAWSPYDIEVGRAKYLAASRKINEAISENRYLGFEAGAENEYGLLKMSLPAWAGHGVSLMDTETEREHSDSK